MHRATLTAAFALLLATPALAGPPWVSIEVPANPHHPSTRGAALMVRAYHHSTSIAVPVHGTAEGIVDGKRVSAPLDLRATNIPGVYALRSALPRTGTWVLAIRVQQSDEVGATALVTLNGRGGIADVEVPSNQNREGWVVPREVKAADIDRALRSAAVAQRDSGSADGVRRAGLLGLPLLLVVFALRRRTA